MSLVSQDVDVLHIYLFQKVVGVSLSPGSTARKGIAKSGGAGLFKKSGHPSQALFCLVAFAWGRSFNLLEVFSGGFFLGLQQDQLRKNAFLNQKLFRSEFCKPCQ